jgi:hypothetical protein
MSLQDVDGAMAWNPTSQNNTKNTDPTKVSYVVAEDSGLYPNERVLGYPLNYQIQDVHFDTIIAHTNTYKSSNLITGTFKIIEPYGVTFLDCLIAAGYNSTNKTFNPYTLNPYMLQLDFFGYDDAGNLIESNASLRKRFPIRLLNIKLDISSAGGAQYTIGFTPVNHSVGLHEEHANTPKIMPLAGKTVEGVLNDFAFKLNEFYRDQAYKKKITSLPDVYVFAVDPSIGNSSIVYPNDNTIADSESSGGVDLSNGNFTISEGTKIISVIDKIVQRSTYITSQITEQGVNNPNSTQTSSFNAFKTTVKAQYGSQDADGNLFFNVHDSQRNQYSKIIVYNVHQYTSFLGNNPNIDAAPDSTPYSIKNYNYIYTGKNTDVIGMKLNFDTTYFNSFLGYVNTFGTQQDSKNKLLDTAEETVGLPPYGVNQIQQQYGLVNNTISPSRYVPLVNNREITTGYNILNSAITQKSADVAKSLQTSAAGDMIVVDLQIIGDPHLIKQDDWFISPNPADIKYAQADGTEFLNTYNFIRTDMGEVVVTLNINTPIDQDADLTGRGLMYWQNGSSSPGLSTFSGQYRILTIKNSFSGGKFEQVLKLARYPNGDLAAQLAQKTNVRVAAESSAVAQNVSNQSASIATNTTTLVQGNGSWVKNVNADYISNGSRQIPLVNIPVLPVR